MNVVVGCCVETGCARVWGFAEILELSSYFGSAQRVSQCREIYYSKWRPEVICIMNDLKVLNVQ